MYRVVAVRFGFDMAGRYRTPLEFYSQWLYVNVPYVYPLCELPSNLNPLGTGLSLLPMREQQVGIFRENAFYIIPGIGIFRYVARRRSTGIPRQEDAHQGMQSNDHDLTRPCPCMETILPAGATHPRIVQPAHRLLLF